MSKGTLVIVADEANEPEVLQTISKVLAEDGHKYRHIELHKALDELVADFIRHTGKLPSETFVLELLEWSHQQTIKPTACPDYFQPKVDPDYDGLFPPFPSSQYSTDRLAGS